MTRRKPAFRMRSLLAPTLLLGCIATLLALSVQTQVCSDLRSRKSALQRQRQFEIDRHLQLLAQWQAATKRERIVPRAIAELGMVDHPTESKEIIALRRGDAASDRAPSFAQRVRESLDRYGNVPAAAAEEEER